MATITARRKRSRSPDSEHTGPGRDAPAAPAAEPPAKRARLAQEAAVAATVAEEAQQKATCQMNTHRGAHREATKEADRARARLDLAEQRANNPKTKNPAKAAKELELAHKFLAKKQAELTATLEPLAASVARLEKKAAPAAAARAAAEAATVAAGGDLQPWAWDCPVVHEDTDTDTAADADAPAWRVRLQCTLQIRHRDNTRHGNNPVVTTSWQAHLLSLAVDPSQLCPEDRAPVRLLARLAAQATRWQLHTTETAKVPAAAAAAPAEADTATIQRLHGLLCTVQETQVWQIPAAHPGIVRMPNWVAVPALSFM